MNQKISLQLGENSNLVSMSGAASLGALPPAGWACSEKGEIKNGEPQRKENDDDAGGGYAVPHALFKHSQSLEGGDVWMMKVVAGGGAIVGIAGEGYDAERHGESYESIAYVNLFSGTTGIYPDISEDGQNHVHHRLLKDR
jgi:hypothetical protein